MVKVTQKNLMVGIITTTNDRGLYVTTKVSTSYNNLVA